MTSIYSAIKRFDNLSGLATKISAKIAGGFILLMIFVVFLDVILRLVFDFSLMLTNEYSEYFLAAVVFLGMANAFRSGAHIRVRLFISRLKTLSQQRYTDLLADLLAIVYLGFLFVYSYNLVSTSHNIGSTSASGVVTMGCLTFRTLIWIPQATMLLGVGIALLGVISHAMALVFGLCNPESDLDRIESPKTIIDNSIE